MKNSKVEYSLTMVSRGIATFTLDTGKCPKWLFERMVKLGREVTRVIVAEQEPETFIERIGDPGWFQSLGTVLAFDWNASGLTTILTAALKEAIRGQEKNLGIFICGGKGKTSRKAPDEIEMWSGKAGFGPSKTRSLIYNSRMAAKVDSSLIQDGFQIYHHSFFFSKNGAWTVVQQGMNKENQSARRYHWHSKNIKDIIREPHSGIASQILMKKTLNMTAEESEKTREISTGLVAQNFATVMKDFVLLEKYETPVSQMAKIKTADGKQLSLLNLEGVEFDDHPTVHENFFKNRYLQKILWILTDRKPKTYEELLATQGVGPKTIRALALVAEIIYGAKPSYRDPARYSFAHGGKDATPFPIDRKTYDYTIESMKKYVQKIKLEWTEKRKIMNRLDAPSSHSRPRSNRFGNIVG